MMQSPTSQATETVGARSLMTGTGNQEDMKIVRPFNCNCMQWKMLEYEQEHIGVVVHFTMHTEFTD